MIRQALCGGMAMLSLSACATPLSADPIEDREMDAAALCDDTGLQDLVGEKATQDVGERVKRESGARIFRWIGPETIVTADYRRDRVNVTYDYDMQITRVRCG